VIYAESRDVVEHARLGFARKWKLRCKGVSLSCEGAGDELFTLYRFPDFAMEGAPHHQCAGANQESRRRTKTQASLPSKETVLLLLFGLLRSGQVKLRRLVGWRDLNNTTSRSETAWQLSPMSGSDLM
jgi:hypothetical protein